MSGVVKKKRLSRHKPEDLYNLVLDIENYKNFIPWCKKGKVVEITSENEMYADLWIGNKLFLKRFTSKITHKKENCSVSAICENGPFKRLQSNWKFQKLALMNPELLKDLNIDSRIHDLADKDYTMIDFYLSFTLKNSIVNMMSAPFYDNVFDEMISYFESRADSLYRVKKT